MNIEDSKFKILIAGIVEREGIELVEYKTSQSRGRLIVRCLVDYPEGGITLDRCGKLNRIILAEIEERFPGLDYLVEVNSPGLDRNLKTEKDFKKVKGRDILLWLNEPIAGKQFLEAKVVGIKSGKLILDCKGESISVGFDKIKTGKQKFRD